MEDIAFTADCDGTEQRYVLWWPETLTKTEGFDLLIALHGHGSDRWQQVTLKRDECKSKRDAATRHTHRAPRCSCVETLRQRRDGVPEVVPEALSRVERPERWNWFPEGGNHPQNS